MSGAFRAVEINHVALRVTDLARSQEFFRTHFGAPGIICEEPGQRYMRMGKNFVALFEVDAPRMDHFAISIEDYEPEAVAAKTRAMGIETWRSRTYVYLNANDDIELQIADVEHEMASPVVRESPGTSTFRGTGVHHVALGVSDVARSREFFQRVLGLPVISETADQCVLGVNDNFVKLSHSPRTGLKHVCFSVEDYDSDRALTSLEAAGLCPERDGGCVSFPGPDGLTVQVAAPG